MDQLVSRCGNLVHMVALDRTSPFQDGGGKVWNRRNLAIGGHIGLWRRCIRDAGIQPNPARRTELVLTRPWSRLMSIAQTRPVGPTNRAA
jgi:hypothetical protein